MRIWICFRRIYIFCTLVLFLILALYGITYSEQVTITTLTENSVAMPCLNAEFGVSVLIETKNQNILFDTGFTTTCIHNANILGKDLSKINKIILSHGHIDHTGGLRLILKSINKNFLSQPPRKIEIIVHPAIWGHKYNCSSGREIYIGMSYPR